MKLMTFRAVLLSCCFFVLSSIARASTYNLECQHYVTNEFPFCSVTLTVLEDGKLSSRATIEHQGQSHPSFIQELDLESGQLFHLNLDADLPGQEIEMIIDEKSDAQGKYPAVLINNQAPFAKEMHGTCIKK
jgi:hypothetical protein